MPKRNQKWGTGDVFTIPIAESEKFGIGQVISAEREALDSVLCVFFGELISSDKKIPDVSTLTPISVQLTTRESLDKKIWEIVENHPIHGSALELFPQLEELRLAGFIGAMVRGSGVMTKLVGAFNCIIPWNSYHDPNYFDALLVPDICRPARAIFR